MQLPAPQTIQPHTISNLGSIQYTVSGISKTHFGQPCIQVQPSPRAKVVPKVLNDNAHHPKEGLILWHPRSHPTPWRYNSSDGKCKLVWSAGIM
ncbi:hypothetical protein AcV5_007419 [Taiwanofungus camphoratus]|nr:hypothetical protein AcV5_007419 [Antrodia cinnamomea]